MVILEVRHLPLLMNIQALHYKCMPYQKIVIKESDQKQSKVSTELSYTVNDIHMNLNKVTLCQIEKVQCW